MLITYTYYHSDIKATPCGFSNVSRSEAAKRRSCIYRYLFIKLLDFLKTFRLSKNF